MSQLEIPIKALWNICVISAGFAGFLHGAARAAEIPYTIGAGPGEKLSGIVYVDDSSGDALSTSGVASGVVNGKYAVDGANTHTELNGTGWKLTVTFNRAEQQFGARLDTCPGPDDCTAGSLVILWEK